MPQIRRAVLLAAGLGTRMLPATKAIPKEMLPVVDKPLIQYAVEEAVATGITEIVMVIADGKEAIVEHFSSGGRVERMLRSSGNQSWLADVEAPANLARFQYFLQEEPKGIAHALQCAQAAVEGEPFALMFPDDLLISRQPVLGQLISAHEATQGSVIAVQPVAEDEVPQYGIVDPLDDSNPGRLRGMVEKPSAAEAPSRLGVVGRYVLSASIFDHIGRLKPGKNGELQLTDALAAQIAAGEPVHAFAYEGRRYDTGRPLGLIAANIGAALARPELRAGVKASMRAALESERC